MNELPDILQQGELARLIPVVSNACREQRNTPTILSGIPIVEVFGTALLGEIGAPSGKPSRTQETTGRLVE